VKAATFVVVGGACAVGALVLAAAACGPVSQQSIGIDAPPEGDFGSVNTFLVHRCGTLDCHGQTGRNLRVWGCGGMRLDAGIGPSCRSQQGGGATTSDETYDTYRSLVGLEPNVMSAVYDGCKGSPGTYPPPSGCHPELLTFIRKSRGTEVHKGGALVSASGIDGGPDPQDVCMVTWLEGQTNSQACSQALAIPSFPIPDAAAE
jgi:hypothetical protein